MFAWSNQQSNFYSNILKISALFGATNENNQLNQKSRGGGVRLNWCDCKEILTVVFTANGKDDHETISLVIYDVSPAFAVSFQREEGYFHVC